MCDETWLPQGNDSLSLSLIIMRVPDRGRSRVVLGRAREVEGKMQGGAVPAEAGRAGNWRRDSRVAGEAMFRAVSESCRRT